MSFCNFWTKSKSLKSLNKISFHEHTPTHTHTLLHPLFACTQTHAHTHICSHRHARTLTYSYTCSPILAHNHVYTHTHSTFFTLPNSLILAILLCLSLCSLLPAHSRFDFETPWTYLTIRNAANFSSHSSEIQSSFNLSVLFSLYLSGTSDSLFHTHAH